MSAPYHCRCGTVVEATTRWNGRSYAIHFWHPDTGDKLWRCPGCETDLHDALRGGHIRDDDGRRVGRDRSTDHGDRA